MTQPSVRAKILTRRSYNRPLNEEGTIFETWEQTVARVIGHQRWLWERAKGHPLSEAEEAELQELGALVVRREALVSGRTLWLGGTEIAKRREASQFNCAGLKLETVHDAVDHMWLLLQGCGVGFKMITGTLSGFTNRIEEIEVVRSTRETKGGREENREKWEPRKRVWTLTIGDSAEAWAKSVGKLLAMKHPARKIVLDFSEIRPAGLRLSGYGWISAGDETVSIAWRAICDILSRRAGQLLDEMDLLDIGNWMGTILSSRRSAEIALMDADNERAWDFARAKDRMWEKGLDHRQQSNNSLIFWKKPSRARLEKQFELIVASGGSEPGFINGRAAKKRAPWFSVFNPCVPLDAWIHTAQGPRTARDLIGKPTYVLVEGKIHYSPTGMFQTGVRPLFRIDTNRGYSLRLTEEHPVRRVVCKKQHSLRTEWTKVKDLRVGDKVLMANHRDHQGWGGNGSFDDGWLLGSMIGDGGYAETYPAYVRFWGPENNAMREHAIACLGERRTLQPYTPEDSNKPVTVNSIGLSQLADEFGVEKGTKGFGALVEQASSDFYRGFIRGFFDADGSVQGSRAKGVSIRLAQISLNKLQIIQRMLLRLGIGSTIYQNRQKEGYRELPDGNGGSAKYWCHKSYELIISGDNMQVYADRIGFQTVAKMERLTALLAGYTKALDRERFCTTITHIEEDGVEPVFDMSVDDVHEFDCNGFRVHNCVEILLANRGFCNLMTLCIPRFNGRFQELLRAMWVVGRANYRQTLVDLKDGILQDAWHQNNEFLRLCGVSGTGWTAWTDLNPYNLRALKNSAVAGAYSMADDLGLQRPKNVTTIKPEGTASKVMGCVGMEIPEGVHKPLGRYIFNNVVFGNADPLVGKLRDAGYRIIPHPSQPDSKVVTLPVEYANIEFDAVDGVEVNLESAVTQLERYRMFMDNYVEQNCSITVSYDPSEVPAIIDWFMEHWDSYVGVSFLFRNDPTKSAADLGYPYLPQEVVTREVYEDYVQRLREVDFDGDSGLNEVDSGDECAGGVCPVR